MAFPIQEILKIQPRQVMKNSLCYLTGTAEIFVVLSVPLTLFIARDAWRLKPSKAKQSKACSFNQLGFNKID